MTLAEHEPLFLAAAVDTAVQAYTIMSRLGPPVDAAAFGVACGELRVRLNITLNAAALLLRTELDRRKL